MLKSNRNLLIIALIAVVNAIGYGIIIPILYTYSHRFGLSDFQNGLLFSVFSLCQFFSTPLIGRLSDKYGRKPLLIISIFGTMLSFLMMAFAPSAIFLFLARALDGFTAGNIPVAAAVISDSTAPKDRAKGFGLMGAAFGFGFIIGPAITGFTVRYGMNVPFIVAAVVALFAVIATAFFLPETNKHEKELAKTNPFDFSHLYKALFDVNVGVTLVLSLIYTMAFSMFTYAYQPLARGHLGMTLEGISLNFTLIGVVGILAQVFVIPMVNKRLGEKKALEGSLLLAALILVLMSLVGAGWQLILLTMFFSLANSFVAPLIQALLSREVDAKSQGSILGVNSSYASIGMILGPIVGGSLASVQYQAPFWVGGLIVAVCLWFATMIMRKPLKAVRV